MPRRYDPVFAVLTLDGRKVWRRRHYRVRRGAAAGTFHLSALDNGVTSKEYWRILDCAEGLDWCVFYYSGAASAAGLSYSGAILASRSGEWPAEAAEVGRIRGVLDGAGIKMWELSNVSNAQSAWTRRWTRPSWPWGREGEEALGACCCCCCCCCVVGVDWQ